MELKIVQKTMMNVIAPDVTKQNMFVKIRNALRKAGYATESTIVAMDRMKEIVMVVIGGRTVSA